MLASRLLHLEGFVEERDGALAGRQGSPAKVPASAGRRSVRLVSGPALGRVKNAGIWTVQVVMRLARRGADLFHGVTRPLFFAFDRALGRVAGAYHEALEWSLDHRGVVLGTATGIAALVAWTAGGLESRLMPRVDQGEFRVEILMPPGTALESTVSAAQRMEELLLEVPETEHVFTHAGIVRSRSALGRQDTGLNTADLTVRLKADRDRTTEAVFPELRERGREIPGATLTFHTGESTFTQVLGAATADLAVKIRGQDLDEMSRLALEVEAELGGIPGIRDIHSDFAAGDPEIRLSLDRRAVETHGLTVGDVVGAVRLAIRGEVATEFQAAEGNVDVLVREDAPSRETLEAILSLGIPVQLDGRGGGRVPLGQLVGWRYTTGPNEVRRESQNRQITVFASVQGRRLDRAIADVEERMALLEIPQGTGIVVGGMNQEMRRSFRSLLFALGLSVLLVYMILAAQFESLVHPFSIMVAIPLAVIGVVPGLWVFGEGVNVMSLLGMVVLTGIVVNDAIIKLDLVNQLRRRGSNLRSALVEAGHYRLRPILMTTVTSVLGLLPMAIKIGAGAELRSPLAVAVIGGLLSATVLTLIVIPVVYSVIEGLRGEALQDRGESFPFPVARQETEFGA
jgi:HAE1 family hydrophobic/amphiphilic exporter-1